MKKPLFALVLSLMLLLTACAPGQAPETSPAPEPESPSASVSEPAPEPEPAPESAPESQPSQPEESGPAPNETQNNPDTALMEQDPNVGEAEAKGEKRKPACPKKFSVTFPLSTENARTARLLPA